MGHKQKAEGSGSPPLSRAGGAARLGRGAVRATVLAAADSYCWPEPAEVIEGNARFLDAADRSPDGPGMSRRAFRRNEAPPWPHLRQGSAGLFYRIAGAISLAVATSIDARIHTTADGMALDNFLIQDSTRAPFAEPAGSNGYGAR